ncbi:MAG: FtsX-like permease family protein [Beijerinckiaceae bacterium]|nr:FtsX-like permease family protein [Beijerinckiaceae bacterium]
MSFSAPRWLLCSLALQNLSRRRARAALLVAAVAISGAIVFTGAVMMRSIETSMATGFSRLGADVMVVAQTTLTNITAALLIVEPSSETLDLNLLDQARIKGIGRAAPQRVFRSEQSGFGGEGESVDLIGYDPVLDFTIQPWITERLGRPMQPGDVILGAARALPLGSRIDLFGKPFLVYAKLGRTGVGTHERGLFMPASDLLSLAPVIRGRTAQTPPMLEPRKVSGFLIELVPGATELQARFALLSHFSGIKVIAGDSLLTGIRQGVAALLGGSLALVSMMFASTALLVSVLFSAITTERRHELGLLKAIGARRAQIVGMLLTEAIVATGAGGAIGVATGVLLLRLFERSLVYYLTQMGVPFLWLDRANMLLIAAVCMLGSALIGATGALIPAWRASRRDPYDLICGEG